MQTGAGQRRRMLRQQHAVGGQRQVGELLFRQHRHQHREVAPQQRFAAGEAHLVDAEAAEHIDQPGQLLERQHVRLWQPDVVLLRHAVLAAEIAAVGHRQAQVAQRAVEMVEQCGHADVVGAAGRRRGAKG